MSAVASPDWVWMRLSIGWMDQVWRLHQERIMNLERMSLQAVESDVHIYQLEIQSENQAPVPQRSLLHLEE